jgi:hypothetical protein
MKSRHLLCLLLLPALLAVSASAAGLHVDADATGAASDASWTDAFTDFQSATQLIPAVPRLPKERRNRPILPPAGRCLQRVPSNLTNTTP